MDKTNDAEKFRILSTTKTFKVDSVKLCQRMLNGGDVVRRKISILIAAPKVREMALPLEVLLRDKGK